MKTLKNLLVLVVVVLLGLSLASCGGDSGLKKVGILKYVTAPALDDAEAGIIEALEKAVPNIPFIMDADIGHVSPKMTMINGAMMTLRAKDKKGNITFTLD